MDDDWFGPGINDPGYDDWVMGPEFETDYLDWCERKARRNKSQTASMSSNAPTKSPSATISNECTLFVRNLPSFARIQDLITVFARHGTIMSVNIVTNEAGASKGFCFIRYAKAAEARLAMAKMNGFYLSGRQLQVSQKK